MYMRECEKPAYTTTMYMRECEKPAYTTTLYMREFDDLFVGRIYSHTVYAGT
jgi:hypothetical protein